ncbi:hypothetical protein sos41_25510 [Alphaproteobacteria bacterium SO-S41]|nr:hypothetical protein sos41_25510 [Alphaproteobacteria bacterium SO-S41]
MAKRVQSFLSASFYLVIGAAAGAAGIGQYLAPRVQAATTSEAAVSWTVDEATGLASARCPTGSLMIGLTKTTSDATVSMDPAAYREIVPLCATLKTE